MERKFKRGDVVTWLHWRAIVVWYCSQRNGQNRLVEVLDGWFIWHDWNGLDGWCKSWYSPIRKDSLWRYKWEALTLVDETNPQGIEVGDLFGFEWDKLKLTRIEPALSSKLTYAACHINNPFKEELFWSLHKAIKLPTQKEEPQEEKLYTKSQRQIQLEFIKWMGEHECIHCETEELAKEICKLMDEAWLRWYNWDSYLRDTHYLGEWKDICYCVSLWLHNNLLYYKEAGKYKIYKAQDILAMGKPCEDKYWYIANRAAVTHTDTARVLPSCYHDDAVDAMTYCSWIPSEPYWVWLVDVIREDKKAKSDLLDKAIEQSIFWKPLFSATHPKQPFNLLTNKPKMSKLQEFRSKLYFTDKKMTELAELKESADDVTELLSAVIEELVHVKRYIERNVEDLDDSVEDGDVKETKADAKILNAILKQLTKDPTFEVVSKSAEALEKLYEELPE